MKIVTKKSSESIDDRIFPMKLKTKLILGNLPLLMQKFRETTHSNLKVNDAKQKIRGKEPRIAIFTWKRRTLSEEIAPPSILIDFSVKNHNTSRRKKSDLPRSKMQQIKKLRQIVDWKEEIVEIKEVQRKLANRFCENGVDSWS